METRIEQVLTSWRDFYGSYHHHKEGMAYAATMVYATGTAWVTFKTPFRSGAEGQTLLMLMMFVAAAALWLFIIWQLRNRRLAAEIVAACNSLLARRLDKADASVSWKPATFDLLHCELPETLIDEVKRVRKQTAWNAGPRVSNTITYWSLGLLTAIAFLRVIGTA